jgi:hypothetical protein
MKGPMDKYRDMNDEQLTAFDQWLKEGRVLPPENLLSNVRAHLRTAPVALDEQIDELLRPNPSLTDPHMAWKVRGRLARESSSGSRAQAWFRWLSPLAAAATLTLAFVSFQTSGPNAIPAPGFSPVSLADGAVVPAVDLDSDMTCILALAANLKGAGEVSKLESMENLAFLFD